MTLLEWYDILVWELKGRMFLSQNYPRVIAGMVKQGYNFIGTMSELQVPMSSVLDEAEGAVSFEQLCNEAVK
jgi:hypothetical protein